MADIVDTLAGDRRFEAISNALEAAGLAETLRGPGRFTVFAPTDAAFSKIPPQAYRELMTDIPRLRTVLLYHVIEGEYTAEDLMEQDHIPTLQGETVGISPTEGLSVNIAAFEESDIEADNGMIHAIDTVLLPKSEATIIE